MMLLTRWGLQLPEYWPGRILAGIVWTISNPWIAIKDAGWLGVIGLICIATYALSSVTARHVRHI